MEDNHMFFFLVNSFAGNLLWKNSWSRCDLGTNILIAGIPLIDGNEGLDPETL